MTRDPLDGVTWAHISRIYPAKSWTYREADLKAHDVRHLTACLHCGRIGDDREMIVAPNGQGGLWHAACTYLKLGDRILDLPQKDREKFTIDDLGVPMMKRLVERCERDLGYEIC